LVSDFQHNDLFLLKFNGYMTKKQRAETVRTELEKLYPQVPVPLDHTDPFTLLVAVALSAQTTDKKVNQVTPDLFQVAGNPQRMAKLEVFEIKELIKEIGLSNQKAKNLKRMAELLMEKHGGVVPQTYEELEALPGVGHKTASVVMSQAFGFPAFPVDTHIHRLMTKWKLTSGKNVVETEKDAKALWPASAWNKLHLQIIYYGREYSPARGNGEKDFITKMLFEK
jgi:endonuclease III